MVQYILAAVVDYDAWPAELPRPPLQLASPHRVSDGPHTRIYKQAPFSVRNEQSTDFCSDQFVYLEAV